MKKMLIVMLAIVILVCPVFANTEELLSSMGIMDNLDNTTVTRGELAKILINASEYSSLAVDGRISPYEDVSFNNKYAPYIKLVGDKGIMTAYSDGEFKPQKVVTYEETITTILKLLGYTNSDFTAGYPASQVKIAKDIGLTSDINQAIGKPITRKNLGELIYNALGCNTKSGKIYATTLGYSTTNGNVTLSGVMSNNVEGPTTYTLNNLPSTDAKIYINGTLSSIDNLNKYDVLYYSDKSNIIWAYRKKVTGMVEEILPNKEAPTTVKISGQNYNLSTSESQKAFALNGIEVGNMVTLLLDRNSEVSDAYLTENLYQSQIGVITSAGKKEIMTSAGKEKYSYYATILLTTGEKLDVITSSNYSSKIGYAAKVTYTNGTAKIFSTRKTADNIYGTFDVENNKLGKNKMSSQIKIIEFDEYGNIQLVYKNRLDGVYINKDSVSLVTLNEKDEIESLVLKNVTGDMLTYAVLTSQIKTQDKQKETINTYNYFLGKDIESYTTSEYTADIDRGPISITKDENSIVKIKSLTKVEGQIVDINGVTLENSRGEKYKISSNVLIYTVVDGVYTKMTLEDAMSGEYRLSAYYDKLEKDGGRIRIISMSLI